ncbi:transposase [Escherichia coli]|nr:transposase [Escherichia coli]
MTKNILFPPKSVCGLSVWFWVVSANMTHNGQQFAPLPLKLAVYRILCVQHERDTGGGDSVLTIGERQRLKELEHENRELRRSNDILRQASAYFAKAELDCLWSSACMNHCSATGAVNSRHYFQCELAMPPVA